MRFAPLTVLFGENNSGKSSITQFLLMLKQTAEGLDGGPCVNLGDEQSLVDLGTFREMIHGRDAKNILGWEITWRGIRSSDPEKPRKILYSGKKIKYSAEIGWGKLEGRDGCAVVQMMDYRYDRCRFGMRLKGDGSEAGYRQEAASVDGTGSAPVDREMSLGQALRHSFKCYEFPVQLREDSEKLQSLSESVDSFLDFGISFELLMSRVSYLGPLRDHPRRFYSWSGTAPDGIGKRGESTVGAMLASAEEQGRCDSGGGGQSLVDSVAFWLRELSLSDSLRLQRSAPDEDRYQLTLRRKGQGDDILLTDAGFGISQVLPVMALCCGALPRSILILEHPEMHLHPSAQEALADMLIGAVQERKLQLIVESHSEHLLLRLQRRIAEGAIPADSTSLLFCSNDGTRSTLQPLDMDEYGMISNWPANLFGDDLGETVKAQNAIHERKFSKS